MTPRQARDIVEEQPRDVNDNNGTYPNDLGMSLDPDGNAGEDEGWEDDAPEGVAFAHALHDISQSP